MLLEFLIILIFLFSSGFFSGIEIAFISADRLRVEVERKKGNKRGRYLANFLDNPSEFLGTTLVGNNIVLVVLSILAGNFLLTHFGINSDTFVGTIQATLITTIIVLIFGEFLPKVSFQINPTGILFFFTYPLVLVQTLLKPLVWVMIKTSNALIEKVFRISTESTEQVFTRLDLDHFISSINTEDEEIDTTLFQNALYIHTVKVRDCMIPRNEIQGIEINESIEALQELFVSTRLSRLLVYNESIDYIEGYVHHQRLFDNPKSIREILWKIPMVHEFTPVQDVMNRLIKEKLNLAWVVDERGGTAGIVALEDILEEIFGEIADEHDMDVPDLKISDNEFVFSGRSEIDTVNEEYELDIPESDEYHTLSGLIVFAKEDIPEQGEKVILKNYQFVAEEVSNTKIEKVRVIRLPEETM
ncbi:MULTISPECIES: hemolysin family protein [unclassified Aureispira]|uniref:hemolysin family protein n=1 Tax=unclassified Aureispira TaxID=2649989 RepID=UPI0006966C32|nr:MULTISPECIES: hemolysin family protein [unclassified Aureispira]WMX14758.1 hemolysin family protein [Aureispira sp. CCB-E]